MQTAVVSLALLPSLLMCQRDAKLDGRVTVSIQGEDSKDPVSNATVRLYSEEQLVETHSSQTGDFQFTNVRPGTYDLEAVANGFKRRTVRGIRIGDEMRTKPISLGLTVSNQPECNLGSKIMYQSTRATGVSPKLTGQVRRYGSQAGLYKTKVEIYKRESGTLQGQSTTNRLGEFTFSLVPPGEYRVQAHRAGYVDETLTDVLVTRRNNTILQIWMLLRGETIVCQ